MFKDSDYPASSAVIIAQAIRAPQQMERTVCVSWWSDGKVTETIYTTSGDGYTNIGSYTPLPRNTTWNDVDFHALVQTGAKAKK